MPTGSSSSFVRPLLASKIRWLLTDEETVSKIELYQLDLFGNTYRGPLEMKPIESTVDIPGLEINSWGLSMSRSAAEGTIAVFVGTDGDGGVHFAGVFL